MCDLMFPKVRLLFVERWTAKIMFYLRAAYFQVRLLYRTLYAFI